MGPSLAFVLLGGRKTALRMTALWELHVEGVDFLAAGVADKDGSAIRGEACPFSDRPNVATKIFQSDDLFGLGLSDLKATVGLIVRKGAVEVKIFAVPRPGGKTQISVLGQPVGPLLCF